MASNAPCVALVVKSRPIPDRSLLIIDKKDVLGLFTTSPLPRVGALITIEWTRSPSKEATVVVSKWESYDKYDPFWKLNAKNSGGVTKFTGCFYTTGCVCHRGVPLENPAIFNDFIGIVRDERRVLQRNYIGKITATVIFVEDASGSYWNLDSVDEGCLLINAGNSKKYRGILHAVGRGQTQTSHFITSRSFPSDILLRTRRDENIHDVETLYGREVAFEVGVDKCSGVSYVIGRPVRAESSLQTIFTEKFVSTTADLDDDVQSLSVNYRSTAAENHSTKLPRKYFSIRTSVEFRGARNDGSLLVWSSELEIIVDTFNLFNDRDHGVYLIDAVRYFEKEKFPRWKVFRIHDLVGKFEILSTACQNLLASHCRPIAKSDEVKGSDDLLELIAYSEYIGSTHYEQLNDERDLHTNNSYLRGPGGERMAKGDPINTHLLIVGRQQPAALVSNSVQIRRIHPQVPMRYVVNDFGSEVSNVEEFSFVSFDFSI
ncbi:unnamed protein product [Nippostrongylus brasiliensis]|uniref:PPIase cyclophilin-type domain-containing protein n=1 Tax=Nippostrongylus brasiliensis TaxID=27835 RepID=A0A0N4YW60_NIPBR|nr:unnamed protein product [Nippostrongylus brasiliensis]